MLHFFKSHKSSVLGNDPASRLVIRSVWKAIFASCLANSSEIQPTSLENLDQVIFTQEDKAQVISTITWLDKSERNQILQNSRYRKKIIR